MKLIIIVYSINFLWSFNISGYVKNSQTGKPIPNANIVIQNTTNGVSSNPYGYFELSIPSSPFVLETSVIGFAKDVQNISSLNENTDLEILLTPTILELSEVGVRGILSSRLNRESIDIIDKAQIIRMDKKSVPDVLQNIPSIDVQFAHPNGRNVNISMRGSSDYKPGGYNNRVLVLLDGFPLLIPSSGSIDWNSLPLEGIEKIEINNSAASSQYGHNSMGGIINLITNSHDVDKMKFKLSSGSFNANKINFEYKNTTGKWFYGSNLLSKFSDGHRFNADSKIQRVQSFIKYNSKSGKNYRVNHLISFSEIGHPGFDLEGSNKYRRSNRVSQYLQLQNFYPIINGLSMSHSIFFHQFNTKYTNRSDIPDAWLQEHELDKETNYDDTNIGLRSEIILTKLSRWIIMVGYDIDWTQSNVDLLNQQYDNPKQLSAGGFIQSKYSIGSGLSFNTGIRYDYRKTIPGNNFKNRVYNQITPKISLNYNVNLKKKMVLSYSQGFRAPSISELYLSHITTYGLEVKGNPNLLPEKVHALEIIYKNAENEKLLWDIAVFYNAYDNMIDFVYNVPTIAQNRESVIANGLEYKFKYSPNTVLTLSGNYSYLYMESLDGDPVLYRPMHKGKLFINIQSGSIMINAGAKYQSKQYYENFLKEFDYENGFPVETLPNTIIPEIILTKEYENFKASLHLSNFSNTKYELIQNYTMPGSTWQLTLTTNL